MFLIIQILVVVVAAAMGVLINKKRQDQSKTSEDLASPHAPQLISTTNLAVVALLANIIFSLIAIFAFENISLYSAQLNAQLLGAYVLAMAVLIAAMLGLEFAFVRKFDVRVSQVRLLGTYRVLDWLLIPISLVAATLIAAGFFLSNWIVRWFGHVSANQLIFTLSAGGGETTQEVTDNLTSYIAVPIVCLALILILIFIIHVSVQIKDKTFSARKIRHISLGVVAALGVASVAYAFTTLPLVDMYNLRFTKTELYDANYVQPTHANVHFPTKRNVVHIYMESVENSYFDKAHGGYDENNYMPDLMALAQEGITFSDTDTFGGPYQTFGTEHSIAAMFAMQTGVPLTADYLNLTNLGDIYHDAGYNLEFMLGADVTWGDLNKYYEQHGPWKIFDHQFAVDNGYLPPDYHVWWGYEDDKLYEFAKQEITRLSQDNKPFYFLLENADTHFPDGYVSKNMVDKPFDKQYDNVIFYSQKEVVKFVNWLKEQPYWPNTTVIINGDHRSMDKTFFEGWDPNYHRTIFNVILNSGIEKPASSITHNREFATWDLFPTYLVASGAEIDGNRLGLGTNLFSGEPTLIEQTSPGFINQEINRDSDWFKNLPSKQIGN